MSFSHSLDLTGCKKRKRGDRIFRFKAFPDQGHPVELNGTFRENVKTLLEYGHFERNYVWSFQLEVRHQPPLYVLLFIVQETIESSQSKHCKQCQYIGWGHHLICNDKYHFLMPSKDTMGACLSYNSNGSANVGNSSKGKGTSLVELEGHMMHGVFHSNGFGHLLCVNGAETGSDLSGHQIMDFWDRLCNSLRARKVSLKDRAQKRGMELRLVHGVAYGETWFGRWGYRFGRGSFGVSERMYEKAVEAIQKMPVCLLLKQELPVLMSRYHALSWDEVSTLSQLLRLLLELKASLPASPWAPDHPSLLVEPSCRWSQKRVEMATRVIVDALRRADFRWVSRQEVRDAARTYIGDTGLLDFVLKSLGNHVVGNFLVRRTLNPVTKVLEYCLQDVSTSRPAITRAQLMKDVFSVYKSILKQPLNAIPVATRIILDSHYLTKDYYRPQLGLGHKLTLFCTVVLPNNCKPLPLPPFECLTLTSSATMDQLKQQVEKRFRDLYWGLKSLEIRSVMDVSAEGTDMVFGVVEVGQKLVFSGAITAGGEDGMCESDGSSGRIVECQCGTKEDDGERMVCCDICEVWQHTRCVRIPNNQQVPHIFLCNRCEHEIVVLPTLP